MTHNTSPFRLIGLFLLSNFTILSWTTVTALPTTHEVVALASPSAVRTSTTQDVTAPVDDASDDSLSMQSYTEKMATGLFGRIPGLEGQFVRHPAAYHPCCSIHQRCAYNVTVFVCSAPPVNDSYAVTYRIVHLRILRMFRARM
jgi:hypothetical protein